jgi:uncharacterized protein (DUF488 family)
VVADVRRFPGSRRNPQFGAEALAAALAEAGVGYERFGEELGGRRSERAGSPNDGWRVAGFRAYADHTASEPFRRGLARLEELARARRTAVMCAEADWRRCHRRLIADALLAGGWRVRHIGGRGGLLDHELPAFAVVAEGRVGYPSQPGQHAVG